MKFIIVAYFKPFVVKNLKIFLEFLRNLARNSRLGILDLPRNSRFALGILEFLKNLPRAS